MKRFKTLSLVPVLAVGLSILTGCVQITRTDPLVADAITQDELEAASTFGPDSLFEPRTIYLSPGQKAEYEHLAGEAAPDEVFFYNISLRTLTTGDVAHNAVGEIYVERGVADTGPFSFLVFVSHGTVSRILLRNPGSIERWDKLYGMLKGLEATTLETIGLKGDNYLTRTLRRALALHAILAPDPYLSVSPSKPV